MNLSDKVYFNVFLRSMLCGFQCFSEVNVIWIIVRKFYFYRNPPIVALCSRAFCLSEAMLEPRQASPTSCMLYAIGDVICDDAILPLDSVESHVCGETP